ncbi:hypothetical protein [Streptomyces platensis]|uniref:hypothetical protein n=1 Tax=Streptomyces platensis TaxID=58346 RepID=UPI001FCB8686|nr:hypothetical protein [Streptomyces platensis]
MALADHAWLARFGGGTRAHRPADPAGQLAWIVEKFQGWTDCGGHPENAVSRQRLLDNVAVYWFAACGASSARLYWESIPPRDRHGTAVVAYRTGGRGAESGGDGAPFEAF